MKTIRELSQREISVAIADYIDKNYADSKMYYLKFEMNLNKPVDEQLKAILTSTK